MNEKKSMSLYLFRRGITVVGRIDLWVLADDGVVIALLGQRLVQVVSKVGINVVLHEVIKVATFLLVILIFFLTVGDAISVHIGIFRVRIFLLILIKVGSRHVLAFLLGELIGILVLVVLVITFGSLLVVRVHVDGDLAKLVVI